MRAHWIKIEYYTAIKNYTLQFTAIWTKLEGIMLSEISLWERKNS